MVRNAFIIEGPVPPDLFFDRREILNYFKRLLELEKYRMLIALLAPFKFGKSSTLIKLKSIAEGNPNLIPILLRLNVVTNPVEEIVTTIVSELGGGKDILEDLRKGGNIYSIFRRLNQLLEKKDRWCLLFIDEFQDLPHLVKAEGFFTKLDDRFVFDFFRGIVEEFRFGLVVSGSLIGPLLDAIDVWHGRFKVYKLRNFPREDSIKMLMKMFDLSGLKISEDVAEYIAMSVDDYPFHMQLFGYNLVNLGKVDEESLEKAREIVQRTLLDYYNAKLLEVINLSNEALEVMRKAIDGIRAEMMDREELRTAILLERRGILLRENSRFEIYDSMFRRFLSNILSNRPEEKYLPEYTAEYLVAKKLAYEEGIKEVLISYMSWGVFDIVILKEYGPFKGIGIQVKRTYGEVSIKEAEIKRIIEASKQKKLLPLLAVVKLPERKVIYRRLDKEFERSFTTIKELLRETL